MRKSLVIIPLIAAGIAAAALSCNNTQASPERKTAGMDSTEKVKRGEYLVSIIGCDDCHSPKRMGSMGPEIIPELRLSGYPSSPPIIKADISVVNQGWAMFVPDLTSSVGPWGVSFSANLTSDETGIGNWTEENFLRAIREGKYKGLETSRPLLPPMPWFVYKNMKDEDLKSIFAYLKTVKPVENVVPAPKTLADVAKK